MRASAAPQIAMMVASAQAGDLKAIDDLLALSQPDIRRYARQSCRIDDIDDAVQGTMVALVRSIGALRAVESLAGWLFMIAKRECLRLARLVRQDTVPIDGIENDLEFSRRPDHELRQDVAAAIQSLPPHYRAIVLKRDLEECSIAEIAQSERLTGEAVKARLRRARSMLREYLLQSA